MSTARTRFKEIVLPDQEAIDAMVERLSRTKKPIIYVTAAVVMARLALSAEAEGGIERKLFTVDDVIRTLFRTYTTSTNPRMPSSYSADASPIMMNTAAYAKERIEQFRETRDEIIQRVERAKKERPGLTEQGIEDFIVQTRGSRLYHEGGQVVEAIANSIKQEAALLLKQLSFRDNPPRLQRVSVEITPKGRVASYRLALP